MAKDISEIPQGGCEGRRKEKERERRVLHGLMTAMDKELGLPAAVFGIRNSHWPGAAGGRYGRGLGWIPDTLNTTLRASCC